MAEDAFNESSVRQLPIFRCLVLQGHEFQTFPAEVKKVFKVNRKQTSDKNIVKWMIKGRRQSGIVKQRTLQGA